MRMEMRILMNSTGPIFSLGNLSMNYLRKRYLISIHYQLMIINNISFLTIKQYQQK